MGPVKALSPVGFFPHLREPSFEEGYNMTESHSGKPWSRAYLEAELTRDFLRDAEKALQGAMATTNDSNVARRCGVALREVTPALRAAQATFDQERLRWAEQQELLEEVEP